MKAFPTELSDPIHADVWASEKIGSGKDRDSLQSKITAATEIDVFIRSSLARFLSR